MKTFLIPTSQVYHFLKGVLRMVKDIKIIFPDLSRDRKRYFPDGEVYIGISEANKLRGERVVVLHSGAPKPNEGLMELELILQILRDEKVKPEVFFTYFPYAMQDKVFDRGETNVAENLIEKLINFYQVKKISIIDPHFGGRKWVKKYPIVNVSAAPLLMERVKKDLGEKALFLSPDKGGERRTRILGFNKKRLGSFNVEMFSPKMNLRGKTVAVVDDMIKTGGTLLKFFEIVKTKGAKKIIALITHGVIPTGIAKVKKNYSKLYLANTIKRKESNIDVAGLIAKNLS